MGEVDGSVQSLDWTGGLMNIFECSIPSVYMVVSFCLLFCFFSTTWIENVKDLAALLE